MTFALVVEVAISLVVYVDHVVASASREDGFRLAALPYDVWLSLLGLAWVPVVVWAAARAIQINRQIAAGAAASAQDLDQVMSVTRDWLWNVDPGGRILSSSDAVEDLLGYRGEELIGRNGSALVVPEDRAEVGRWWDAQVGSEAGWERMVVRLSARDGHVRHVETTGVPVLDERGLLGFRGSARDVSDAVRLRQREATDRRTFDLKRRRIESLLVDRSQMRMVFQPIIDLRTRQIVGVEALARINLEPVRPPDVWFAEAAEVGLGTMLEATAVRQALTALDQLDEDVYLSVNASPQALIALDLLDVVAERPEIGSRLVIELTEHETITDYDQVDKALRHLRELGVRLAVDDAGAGHSTLRHILRLRPEAIKLDRTLTAEIDRDPVRRALAAAFVTFSTSIGAALIAEGVERDEELGVLLEVGVRHGQGYLFGRPAVLEDLPRKA